MSTPDVITLRSGPASATVSTRGAEALTWQAGGRGLLWQPEHVVHPNGALALTEAVYAVAAPAGTMARLSRLAGRPAEPDPLGGYRISCGRGAVRVLPPAAAETLFPGVSGGAPLTGLTIAAAIPEARVVHAGGVAIRFVPASP